MRLTHESPRARWLILLVTWALVAGIVAWQTLVMRDYLASLDRAGSRAVAVDTPLRRIIPSNFTDAQMWMRHALALEEGAPAQVRFTDTDNVPFGREVHWNSAFAHLIAAAGRLEQARTGVPLPRATEDALRWFNLPLFLAFMVLCSAWTARRAGAGAGVLVACGMLGLTDFYGGFWPMYADHHGLLTTAVFGVVLGAMFMGGGWCPPSPSFGATRRSDAASPLAEDAGSLLPDSLAGARAAAIFSALSGAFGLWISAASVIPAIALTGITAVAAGWWLGPAAQRGGAVFEGGLWRLWGRVGAGVSLFFYFLEYAPSHLSWRLEVNHPLYALAWWGGGELVAQLAEWRLGAPRRAAWRIAWPVLAVAAAPLMMIAGGPKVFAVHDPFLGRLVAMVGEGVSLPRAVEVFGPQAVFDHLSINVLPWIAAGVVLVRRRSPDRIVLAFVALATLGFIAMACGQVRWWLNTGGPQICVALVLVAALGENSGPRARWGLVLLVGVGVLLPTTLHMGWRLRERVREKSAERVDLAQTVFRDVAAALRATQPAGDIVLLASPNASASVGYYGRFKTIGTLYWENTAGLRAAAEMFSATTDVEARRLLQARGVTHVALISEGDFLEGYFHLLRPELPANDIKKTFGYRLMIQHAIPLWLRAIPYRPPLGVAVPNLSVLLLQVVPQQTEAEARWNFGLYQTELGFTELAEGNFNLALAAMPPAQRATFGHAAGDLFFRRGWHAGAVRFYRAALAVGEDPVATCNLAWLLATSTDDTVRNGANALALAEQVMRANPNALTSLNTLAAALAENGRFAEAIAAVERGLAGARAANDPSAVAQLEAQLAAYRAGRPWRQ